MRRSKFLRRMKWEGRQHFDMKLDVAGHMLGFDAAREIGPFFGVQIRP